MEDHRKKIQAELFDLPWAALPAEEQVVEVGGALGSSRALVVAATVRKTPGVAVLVTPDQPSMEEWIEELEFFGLENADEFWESTKTTTVADDDGDSPIPVFPFPHLETLPYENKAPEAHLKSDRLRIYDLLSDLSGKNSHRPRVVDRAVIVVPVRSLMARLPDLSKVHGSQRVLRVGAEIDRDELARFLLDEGYEAQELISDSGQFSIRGGIVDIFPFTSTEPARVELFGDEIDSIRTFDLLSQRSTRKVDTLILSVADETRQLLTTWNRNEALHSLAEFLPKEARVFWDSPELIEEEANRVLGLAKKMYDSTKQHEEAGELDGENPLLDIPPDRLYRDWTGVREELENVPRVDLTEFAYENPSGNKRLNLAVSRPNLEGVDFKMKIQAMIARAKEGERFAVVCDNEGQRERLYDLALDGLEEKPDEEDPKEAFRKAALRSEKGAMDFTKTPLRTRKKKRREVEIPGIGLMVGALRRGFCCDKARLTLVTDQEIYGRFRKLRIRRKSIGLGSPIVDLVDLAPGNYVVHVDHGIGRFVGLKRLKVGGREGEFLELRYDAEDVLYVPIEQIDRITRYVGAEEAPPKLSKMGSKVWQKAKARAKKAIEDLTDQLLSLYAAREVREGFAFPSDTTWQHEFEASFPYDETPDQWKAIQDVKEDMEAPRCMDRLVCGDVGFGKTEVAMRAAFKAVCEGKQVAILAPTTVLVQQHYETFFDRMIDYPVEIESLSRFRTAKETKPVLEKTGQGDVDIVIGTHRLLQKDIHFKDLGLVIVDEEQRFGVKHKERLKQMRSFVDVLTLTATPIPRTLYMSMSGVRDMSLVNTPPKDRLPVETYVMEFKDEVVESAILRELARGGQVFFLHNRVESIYGMASLVQEIVPEARVAVGHGQMGGHELEKVMNGFISGEVDVLVSTTIVESGLDIPNANTILINRADAFGLGELYQLRGRVGRAKHQAYCYLLVPSKQRLTPVARQRLLALQEHTALGSGFQIAMRDLEIRGMGNILGKEQSGHIAAIGYDLYSSLLAKEVHRMRGEAIGEETSVVLDTFRPGEFPEDYVPSGRQRMSIHKRMANVETAEQKRSLQEEIADLYGKPPAEADLVFTNLDLKLAAKKARVDHLKVRANGARLRLNEKATREFSPELVVRLDQAYPGKIRLIVEKRVYLEIKPPDHKDEWEIVLAEVLGALTPDQVEG